MRYIIYIQFVLEFNICTQAAETLHQRCQRLKDNVCYNNLQCISATNTSGGTNKCINGGPGKLGDPMFIVSWKGLPYYEMPP